MTLAVPVSTYGAKEGDERKERNSTESKTRDVSAKGSSRLAVEDERSSIERTTVSRPLRFALRRAFVDLFAGRVVRTPAPSSFRGRYPLRLADLFSISFPRQQPERRLGKIPNETKIACSLASPAIEIQGKRGKKRNWPWRGNRRNGRPVIGGERAVGRAMPCHAMQRYYASFHHR